MHTTDRLLSAMAGSQTVLNVCLGDAHARVIDHV